MKLSPEDVHKKLTASQIPRLWIPSADDFIAVERIPVVGIGKVDLRRLKQIAKDRPDR
jgi:hypothetical protein